MFSIESASGPSPVARVRKALNRSCGFIEGLVWGMFCLSLLVAVWPRAARAHLALEPFLVIDGLTRVIWPYVTLLTGVLLNFSKRYLAGNHRVGFFFLRCFFFLLCVMVLAATDHLLLFMLAWGSMGWFMAGLIGHKTAWKQARAAGRLARGYLLGGILYLGVGILVLYQAAGSLSISDSLAGIHRLTGGELSVVFACFLVAGIIQSALFPVQNWLMSSMTAPTPASALMHAGFVNAGGILFTRFARVFTGALEFMLIVAAIGAVSAMMGKIWKLVQTAIKRQLGCSTVAQMGFMLLQCGLGYFTAAIAHLILHGFYKGYLFLSAGTAVEDRSPDTAGSPRTGPVHTLVGLLTGLAGGVLFVMLTGKGLEANSGLFLAFIVVLTILHGSRDVLGRVAVPTSLRHVVFPLLVLLGTAVYSAIFNLVTAILGGLPAVGAPTPLTWVHAAIAVGFVALWLARESDLISRSDRLYVYILNASQPHPATILSAREEYHV